MDKTPWLSTEELATLREGTIYSYQAGCYPPDFPTHLREYADGDGGLLNLLDQIIELSWMYDGLTK